MGLIDIANRMNDKWLKSSLRPLALATKSWSYYFLKKGGAVVWILGITLIMVGFPLVLEVEREQQLIEYEKQYMQQQYGIGQQPQLAMTPVRN